MHFNSHPCGGSFMFVAAVFRLLLPSMAAAEKKL
jgi:hypothetical protein